MKLKKRIGAAVLAVAMASSLLAGCGTASGGSQSSSAGTADTASTGEADNTYTMFMRSTYVDWIKELKWYDVAEERTGIHVEYISGPEEFNDVYS